MSFDALLADALARGLTNFSLHRKGEFWQSSSKWTWSTGFRCYMEPTAQAAVSAALSSQPVSDQRMPVASVSSVASAEQEDIFG